MSLWKFFKCCSRLPKNFNGLFPWNTILITISNSPKIYNYSIHCGHQICFFIWILENNCAFNLASEDFFFFKKKKIIVFGLAYFQKLQDCIHSKSLKMYWDEWVYRVKRVNCKKNCVNLPACVGQIGKINSVALPLEFEPWFQGCHSSSSTVWSSPWSIE